MAVEHVPDTKATSLKVALDGMFGTHIMVCYIERDVFVSIEESKIIERFQGYRNRKGVLPRPRRKFSNFASIIN